VNTGPTARAAGRLSIVIRTVDGATAAAARPLPPATMTGSRPAACQPGSSRRLLPVAAVTTAVPLLPVGNAADPGGGGAARPMAGPAGASPSWLASAGGDQSK
jgi:hypothetical protein